jgi:hypothetical protein
MTIEEVRIKQAELETAITQLLQAFQLETGTIVHSVPVTEQPGAKITARVKVQI